VGCACGLGEVFFFEPVFFVDGADEKVRAEADDEQAGHDVENERVGILFRQLVGDVVVEDAVDDERTDDSGAGPRCEETTVDCGDVVATEEIFEIGRDGGEASAVHGEQDDGDADKERNRVEFVLAGERQDEIENGSQSEEDEVGAFASDEVGDGGPEETAGHVEDAEKADESDSGRGADAGVEEVLNHRRGLFEDADAGGDVGEENDPEEPELGGSPCVVDGDVVGGDEAGGLGGRGPTFGLPAVLWDADGEDAEHHEDEIKGSHGHHGEGDGRLTSGFEVSHEIVGERAADHGAATKAHDGEAGGKAGAVGEPLDES